MGLNFVKASHDPEPESELSVGDCDLAPPRLHSASMEIRGEPPLVRDRVGVGVRVRLRARARIRARVRVRVRVRGLGLGLGLGLGSG